MSYRFEKLSYFARLHRRKKERTISESNLKHSEWVEIICSGDALAFEYLFNAYSEPLLDFAMTYVKDTQISEDIVQDIFVKIWLNRTNLNPQLSIKSYLFKAVRNQALKHLRHVKVEKQSEEKIRVSNNSVKSPEDDLNEKNLTNSVHQAIGKLPEKCRLIFTMNRFDGLTYAEIAEIQDISINTVKTQMGRAFAFLRKCLAFYFSAIPIF